MEAFREYFNHADKDRLKSLTTKEAGFHSANATKVSETTKQTSKATDHFTDPKSGRKIYYCWSHGATTNASHTSATCNRPKEGHIKEATWFDMQGGCCEFKKGKNNIRIEKKKTTTTANATAATVVATTEE